MKTELYCSHTDQDGTVTFSVKSENSYSVDGHPSVVVVVVLVVSRLDVDLRVDLSVLVVFQVVVGSVVLVTKSASKSSMLNTEAVVVVADAAAITVVFSKLLSV